MPVRLTDTVDHQRPLFRGRRAVLVGWAPHPMEERRDAEGEWVLTMMPLAIYLKFEDVPWTIDDDLGQGVYPLTPVVRNWTLNKRTKVKVRRKGFFLIPDFASTAHMIQGQSLSAAFLDLLTGDDMQPSTEATQISGYVMLSRARDPSRIFLLRPFPREIFMHGPPTGPDVLLRKLRGDIDMSDVSSIIDAQEKEKAKSSTNMDPMRTLYRCMHCVLVGRTPAMKPPVAFGAQNPSEIAERITRHGIWTRCTLCQETASALRIRTKKGLRTRQTTTEPTTLQTTTEPTTLQTTDPAGLVCDRCKLQRPAYYCDPWTFYNRKRNQTQCCNVCKPLKYCTPCGQWKPCTAFRRGAQMCKDCQLVPCAICQQTMLTHHFVPSDVRHHFSKQRAIVCLSLIHI